MNRTGRMILTMYLKSKLIEYLTSCGPGKLRTAAYQWQLKNPIDCYSAFCLSEESLSEESSEESSSCSVHKA